MNPKRVFCLIVAWLLFLPLVQADDASLAAIFTNAPVQHAASRRTSVIVITCEGLARGDLSCYGQTHFQTPNLDQLAAEGTRFTGYHATGDDSAAEMAALMTGNTTALSNGVMSLSERLHEAGYRTCAVGVWPLSAKPWNEGFDEFVGFFDEREADNYFSDFVWRYGAEISQTEANGTRSAQREEIYQNTGGHRDRFLPDTFMSAAINFTRIAAPDRANWFRPFFLYVNLPLPRSVSPGKDEYTVPTDAPYTDETWPQAAKNRAALIGRLDTDIGRLREELNKLKLTNNVAIFFSGLAAPQAFANTNLNFLELPGEVRGGHSEGRLSLPMIVHWPDHVPAGRVSPAPWTTPDLAPTILQLTESKPIPSVGGMSMLRILLNEPGTIAPDFPEGSGRPNGGPGILR
jgi:arylsulfatase A-like enzyme